MSADGAGAETVSVLEAWSGASHDWYCCCCCRCLTIAVAAPAISALAFATLAGANGVAALQRRHGTDALACTSEIVSCRTLAATGTVVQTAASTRAVIALEILSTHAVASATQQIARRASPWLVVAAAGLVIIALTAIGIAIGCFADAVAAAASEGAHADTETTTRIVESCAIPLTAGDRRSTGAMAGTTVLITRAADTCPIRERSASAGFAILGRITA